MQERKAAKPNADSIARSKKLWERLRRKSHVELSERKILVAELFEIITSRVKDFVFKHDSVRVIQTALKYANLEQRKMIARELKAHYKDLAESRYAKFLIGKILVHGDEEIRDMVVPELYTHVRRLIKHPEAAWILDDIYRGIATPAQKSSLLCEWYGAEFALFKPQAGEKGVTDLRAFLESHPEKRTPVMRSLHDLINLLVQKKTTGFTMLHDAMLQYFLNTTPGSTESNDFLELLKGDEEGDLLKNLAFTASGSRLVCLALAHGTAKDRKQILRVYKGLMQALAYDVHGHCVLLTAYEVIDDTVLTSRLIFPELLGTAAKEGATSSDLDQQQQHQDLLDQSLHLTARIPLLHIFAALEPASADDKTQKSRTNKAILSNPDTTIIHDIRSIRTTTSKKDPLVRRRELLTHLSDPLLAFIAVRSLDLTSSSFGCVFVTEVLLGAIVSSTTERSRALDAIIACVVTKPDLMPFQARMLKSLIQGGKYSPATKSVTVLASPALDFHERFYDAVAPQLIDWATGENSFCIVALLEAAGSEGKGFTRAQQVRHKLLEQKEQLQQATKGQTSSEGTSAAGNSRKNDGRKKRVEKEKGKAGKGNKGSALLLQLLGEDAGRSGLGQ